MATDFRTSPIICPVMNEHLQQLESIRHSPSRQVTTEQRPAIIGKILHHLMYPYFLKRTPERQVQERFGETQYQLFMQALADFCLRGYVENPEPRLTLEVIKGLHRQFCGNAANVSVKAVDGSLMSTIPGEFKTTPVFIRRHSVPGEWINTTAPDNVVHDIECLLEVLHNEQIPLFQRYLHLIVDLSYIHPFPDSNGKVAMTLGDLFLLKQGVQPPYFAKYKWENEPEIYGLYDEYFLSEQKDISIFYPLLLKVYEGSDRDLENA